MHSKTSSSCVISATVAIAILGLSWLFACRYQWTITYISDDLKECQLVIGILSARGNFEHRRAIRETWFPRTSNTAYCVHAYFIIGQDSCQIPPEDRIDEYDCKPWAINLNEVGNESTIHFTSVSASSVDSQRVFLGLSFQVQHPIVITKLGILDSIIQSGKSVSAILRTTAREEVVAQVTFSSQNSGTLANGYFYRPIEPLILPKGFEGTLFLSDANYVANLEEKLNVTYSNGSGLLSFQQTISEMGIGRAFDNRGISAVSLGFAVYDLQTLKLQVQQQTARKADWDAKLRKEASFLNDEMSNHGDLVIVNATDFYRNLPLKLLLFYEWVVQHYNFNYLLKADDDSVLNVANISRFLEFNTEINKLWWGRFRYNWFVHRSGKWREVNFGALVYPPFACGTANVISSDIIQWAARNRRELHNYQGEDVSVGIWLSAIAPTYIQDAAWQCEEGCQKDALSRGQLDPDEIRRSWEMFAQCGHYCDCDV